MQAIKISFDAQHSDAILEISEADRAALLERFAEDMLADKLKELDQKYVQLFFFVPFHLESLFDLVTVSCCLLLQDRRCRRRVQAPLEVEEPRRYSLIILAYSIHLSYLVAALRSLKKKKMAETQLESLGQQMLRVGKTE